MAVFNPFLRPRLRPIEARPVRSEDGELAIHLHDPSQHAAATLTVSPAAFFLLSQMDGEHTLEQIETAFAAQFGQGLRPNQLPQMVEQLSKARLLDDQAFAEYYQGLVTDYRQAPARQMRDGPLLGESKPAELPARLNEMLAQATVADCPRPVTGLVVPHLDFARGAPCYADGYATLARHNAARRFILLGTNHFGQATAVVSTGKDFVTPLGAAVNDREFLDGLQAMLGADLCEHELDHAREHSIELQVVMLQHLFGSEDTRFVPFLCPSPCGPTGTRPIDGRGADLRVFAETLRECIAQDGKPTCIIAGADLSHVGAFFGDERQLDEAFLSDLADQDRKLLAKVLNDGADGLLAHVNETANSTRVCSVGCLYALLVALPEATPNLLRYHQAVVKDWQNCVSCAAVTFC